jgi:hypothetical protein
MQHIVFLQHLHVVGEDAQHGALPRLLQRHDLEQPLVRVLEVLDLDQVVPRRAFGAEQAVGAHEEGTGIRRTYGKTEAGSAADATDD